MKSGSIENWDEIRTALAVARAGTVSGGAQAIGVHHATVIRHIDTLESRLGARLFQRHPRGYALTEAGQMLLAAATGIEERLSQLSARISGAGERVEGDLTITSIPGLAGVLAPALARLLAENPALHLRYLTDPRLFRLEAGEAHLAIRAGARPTDPDYIVQPLMRYEMRLYAAPAYLERHGPVESVKGHRFITAGDEARGAPCAVWLRGNGPAAVVQTNDEGMRFQMVADGQGLGFFAPSQAQGLTEVMALPQWNSDLWLVTHLDLHRSAKVQAALAVLKSLRT